MLELLLVEDDEEVLEELLEVDELLVELELELCELLLDELEVDELLLVLDELELWLLEELLDDVWQHRPAVASHTPGLLSFASTNIHSQNTSPLGQSASSQVDIACVTASVLVAPTPTMNVLAEHSDEQSSGTVNAELDDELLVELELLLCELLEL